MRECRDNIRYAPQGEQSYKISLSKLILFKKNEQTLLESIESRIGIIFN
jgi:hypothetical protein